MRMVDPEPKTVTVIDFDITLACGKDIQFTLRPDLGDTESATKYALLLFFSRTQHHVKVNLDHLAVLSRRERQMALPPEPKADSGRE
jgi:hypothetical protein